MAEVSGRCKWLHQSTPKVLSTSCLWGHCCAGSTVWLLRTQSGRRVPGLPPHRPLSWPSHAVGKLKVSYAHLCRLIPGVRQGLLPPTCFCYAASALHPLHPQFLCCQVEKLWLREMLGHEAGAGWWQQPPQGTTPEHAGAGFVPTGVLKCSWSQPTLLTPELHLCASALSGSSAEGPCTAHCCG